MKATLLGYSLQTKYQLVLARSQLLDGPSLDTVVRQVLGRGSAEGLYATRCGREVMVLIPEGASSIVGPPRLVETVTAELPDENLSWGVADDHVTLRTLDDGLSVARKAEEIGRVLYGPGAVGYASSLEPFFILSSLARDPDALRTADRLLQPLVEYDAQSSGSLLQTLQIFLDEMGNISAAARHLYLNRHSLIYRIHKIESLTGRDLSRPEDRFILDVSLRLRRLVDTTKEA